MAPGPAGIGVVGWGVASGRDLLRLGHLLILPAPRPVEEARCGFYLVSRDPSIANEVPPPGAGAVARLVAGVAVRLNLPPTAGTGRFCARARVRDSRAKVPGTRSAIVPLTTGNRPSTSSAISVIASRSSPESSATPTIKGMVVVGVVGVGPVIVPRGGSGAGRDLHSTYLGVDKVVERLGRHTDRG